MSETDATTRRSLLSKIWIGLGGLALMECVWVLTDFFRPRRRDSSEQQTDSLIIAGPVDRFEPGSVTAFQQGKFYLARLKNGGFIALYRKCTHLGCTVPWISEEDRFVCPCHASVFDIKGQVLSPPAPRPLDTFALRIENGIVKVDTLKVLKRTGFSDEQVAKP